MGHIRGGAVFMIGHAVPGRGMVVSIAVRSKDTDRPIQELAFVPGSRAKADMGKSPITQSAQERIATSLESPQREWCFVFTIFFSSLSFQRTAYSPSRRYKCHPPADRFLCHNRRSLHRSLLPQSHRHRQRQPAFRTHNLDIVADACHRDHGDHQKDDRACASAFSGSGSFEFFRRLRSRFSRTLCQIVFCRPDSRC